MKRQLRLLARRLSPLRSYGRQINDGAGAEGMRDAEIDLGWSYKRRGCVVKQEEQDSQVRRERRNHADVPSSALWPRHAVEHGHLTRRANYGPESAVMYSGSVRFVPNGATLRIR